ncbi:MAG: hypothetical protein AAFR23_00075, partial [Pseudomonadota bacterium]
DAQGTDADTCVVERLGSEQFTDAPPTGSSVLRRGSIAGGSQYHCPLDPVIPIKDLRNDSTRTAFKSSIDAITPGGWTSGHLGAAWGWYSVSPNWANTWPSSSRPLAYGRRDVIKAVVLMTDGVFNTAHTGNPSDTSTNALDPDSSAYQALQLCTAMRNAGVMLYAVSFQAPETAEQLMEDCAGGTENAYNADTASDLINSFRDIAVKLQAIRLTN